MDTGSLFAVALNLPHPWRISQVEFKPTEDASWNCIFIYYVDKARALEDYSEVTAIGMDETSKKGHNYITVIADLSQRKVIFVTDGKDSTTVQRFAANFEAHRGNTERVGLITCDMSLGFRKGIQESFENSQTIIDKFHVIKHANEAVDKFTAISPLFPTTAQLSTSAPAVMP